MVDVLVTEMVLALFVYYSIMSDIVRFHIPDPDGMLASSSISKVATFAQR